MPDPVRPLHVAAREKLNDCTILANVTVAHERLAVGHVLGEILLRSWRKVRYNRTKSR